MRWGVMRGDTSPEERWERRMARMPTNSRILILLFPTAEEAERWDKLEGAERLQTLLVDS